MEKILSQSTSSHLQVNGWDQHKHFHRGDSKCFSWWEKKVLHKLMAKMGEKKNCCLKHSPAQNQSSPLVLLDYFPSLDPSGGSISIQQPVEAPETQLFASWKSVPKVRTGLFKANHHALLFEFPPLCFQRLRSKVRDSLYLLLRFCTFKCLLFRLIRNKSLDFRVWNYL